MRILIISNVRHYCNIGNIMEIIVLSTFKQWRLSGSHQALVDANTAGSPLGALSPDSEAVGCTVVSLSSDANTAGVSPSSGIYISCPSLSLQPGRPDLSLSILRCCLSLPHWLCAAACQLHLLHSLHFYS